MLTYIRYALATVCFAASVGCLVLWGWSTNHKCVTLGRIPPSFFGGAIVTNGFGAILFYRVNPDYGYEWKFHEWQFHVTEFAPSSGVLETSERFSTSKIAYHFPLWFPALVFGLASVGILRVGRFTIRSVLIATTVAAVLLGMVVML